MVAVCLFAAVAAFTLVATRTASAGADISGSWEVAYSLACTASLTQSGSDVSGSVDCGAGLSIMVDGTFDTTERALSLAGDYAGVDVTIEGDVSDDGASIEGTWAAPPLVPEGPYTGVRDSPNEDDVAGLWLINVENVFASECAAEIEQDGSDVSAELDCADGLSGTFEGSFTEESQLTLTGPFGAFGSLEMRIDLDDDGESFNGVWHLLPDGPSGVVDGERAGEEPDDTPRPATPTPLPGLAPTGGGPPSDAPEWPIAAVAGVLALGAACLAFARRGSAA
jgi:hypothetical protein